MRELERNYQLKSAPVKRAIGDELPSAMLAIAWAAVMLVASEIYLEKKSTHVPSIPAANAASAPQPGHSR
jgi:hypothetical protein